ncbi:UDP-N-acetylmuramoylalanine--D-glutamate ligase [Leptospira ryugenii]|uniref:UDP-N-acetylmuramoylalanine--D-glutamate ligase n=1 Tax=Leptospira ryugenii TaxID=1917863 RepID=A0A2P2DVI2_9LEPT|nr:UDP-N-acetylmuramoyl-L-alanine--D-glutamate ligase [Leptospira ryugenii]GBF48633.1 UDP-N-acetylmuramoylalanine--D-glutamate ligase [Leptospira ryugenii]
MFSLQTLSLHQLLSFHKFLVIGGGISGESAGKLLADEGKIVSLYDRSKPENLSPFWTNFYDDSRSEEAVEASEILIKSPGVSPEHPILLLAEKKQKPILSEIYLGRLFYTGNLIGITGTDGKSTTTTLTYHLIRAKFPNSAVGGNLGEPFTSFCKGNWDFVVLELSSYQLEDSPPLHPLVSAITNLATDHLERHKTMERYFYAKSKIADLGSEGHTFITQSHLWDEFPKKPERVKAKVLTFGTATGEDIEIQGKAKKIITKQAVYSTDSFPLPGDHNLQNLAVAIGIAESLGIESDTIQSSFISMEGLSYRYAKVKLPKPKYPNVTFINDSKSTNMNSLLAGLNGFSKEDRLYLILGGEPKEESLAPFFAKWKDLDAEVWIYGNAAKIWEEKFRKEAPKQNFTFADTVQTVLKEIKSKIEYSITNNLTLPVTVLFSPACASFDQYKNFSERGRHFDQLVSEEFQEDLI